MVTSEEHISYLAQQLNSMQTDVAELQNALQGSATRCADLMVQLFTSESKEDDRSWRRGDSSHVKVESSGDEKHRCDDECCTGVQRLRSDRLQATDMEWREGQRIVHIQDGIAELGWKVMDVTEAKEGRRMELDTRNAGMSQETVDDFKELDRRLYQVLISCTGGEAKNHVCNPERSGFKAWKQMVSHFDPRTGADRSVAYARVTHPVSQSGLTPSGPKTLQSARNIVQTGTRGGRI